MFFKHTLKRLIQKGKSKYHEFVHLLSIQVDHHPPQGAPAIIFATKPNVNSHATNFHPPAPSVHGFTYWHPKFHQSTPIWTYFEQETGSHGWGNNELQNYTNAPANSFFTPDNKLVIRAISNPNASLDQYTSARLVSEQKLDRERGCVAAILTIPCARGIWPAFWLLPAEPCTWPTDGEVDICESWNGQSINHSCIHWGHYNAEDSQKHRVMQTIVNSPHMMHEYAFAWEQSSVQGTNEGRLMWYIDDRPVMRAFIPEGIRPMQDFRIILNVAMGGNVCQGTLPDAGTYDMVVHDLRMIDEPRGGWNRFHWEWNKIPEGHAM